MNLELTVITKSHLKERNPEGSYGYMIEHRITLSDSDIEKMMLDWYKKEYPDSIEENRFYECEVEDVKLS